MSERWDEGQGELVRVDPSQGHDDLTQATPSRSTAPYQQTVRAGGKVLWRFTPEWTIDYIDPDLLASLKEWLREEHP